MENPNQLGNFGFDKSMPLSNMDIHWYYGTYTGLVNAVQIVQNPHKIR